MLRTVCDRAWIDLRGWLEDDFAGELQDTGREGRASGDNTEGAGAVVALREGVVGDVEDVEGFGAEVEADAFVDDEVFVESEIELVEGIEADGVTSDVAVGVVDIGKSKGRVADRVVESDQRLIARVLDALRLGNDDVLGDLVGALHEDGADGLRASGGVGDVDGHTAVGAVDRRDLPSTEGLLHEQGSVAAERAAFAVGKVVDNGERLISGWL